MGGIGIRFTFVIFIVLSLVVGCVPPERNMRLQWLIKQKKKSKEPSTNQNASPGSPRDRSSKSASKKVAEPPASKVQASKPTVTARELPTRSTPVSKQSKPTAAKNQIPVDASSRKFAKKLPPPPDLPEKQNKPAPTVEKVKPIEVDRSGRKNQFNPKTKPQQKPVVPPAPQKVTVSAQPNKVALVGPPEKVTVSRPAPHKKQGKQIGLLTADMLRDKNVRKVTLVDADAAVDSPPPASKKKRIKREQSVFQTTTKVKTEKWAELLIVAPRNARTLHAVGGAKKFYSRAFASYSKGDYGASNQLFRVYLRKYPQDFNTDNAQFWIGQALYKQGLVEEAEAAFQKVLSNYEHGPTNRGYKTPDSILMLARIQKKKGLNLKARYYYSKLIELYPQSRSGNKAKQELSEL